MYDSWYLDPRRKSKPLTQAIVDQHAGSPTDFLRRHERLCAELVDQPGRRKEMGDVLRKRIFDSRTLFLSLAETRRRGGAAGADGITLTDVEDFYLWPVVRSLRSWLQSGDYFPERGREVQIPKSAVDPSRGCRTITIRSVIDRSVDRAVLSVIQPLLDPLFDSRSFGFRPRRGRHDALAHAEHLTLTQDRRWWVVSDVRNAFDQVPRGRLLQLVESYLFAPDVADLVGRIIGGVDGRGIPQGSPLSPLLLNLYLHHFLDRPWRERCPDLPLIRVADDIVILCGSLREAKTARGTLENLLAPAGMPLKEPPQDAVKSLGRPQGACWLGFNVAIRGAKFQVRLAKRAWQRLEERLRLLHRRADAPLWVLDVLHGWVDAQGPTYEPQTINKMVRRLMESARGYAFDEIPNEEHFRSRWQTAFARHQRLRLAVHKELSAQVAEERS